MKKTTGKTRKYNTETYIIGMSVFFVIMLLVVSIDFNRLFVKPEDLNSVVKKGGKPHAGDYVSVEVAMYDKPMAYAEANYKLYGIIPSGREYYYIFQLDNGAYISLSVRKDIADKLEGFENGKARGTVTVTGEIEKMNDEIQDYYTKTLGYFGVGDEGNTTVYNLTIDATDSVLAAWILIIVSLIFMLLFAFMLVRAINFKKRMLEENKEE